MFCLTSILLKISNTPDQVFDLNYVSSARSFANVRLFTWDATVVLFCSDVVKSSRWQNINSNYFKKGSFIH